MCFCICDLFWFLAESLVPKKKWNQVTRWVGYDFAKKMDELWHTMTNHVFEGTNRSIRDGTSRNSSYRGMKLGWRIHRFGLKTPHPKRNWLCDVGFFRWKWKTCIARSRHGKGQGAMVSRSRWPLSQRSLFECQVTASELIVAPPEDAFDRDSSGGFCFVMGEPQSSPWLLTYTKSLRHPRRLDDLGYPHGLETYIWDISSGSWDSMVPPGWCLLVCNRH